MSRCFQILLAVFSVLSVFPAPAVAQHECGCHSSNWHSHEGDGYWQNWWKIVEWEAEYVYDLELIGASDEWSRLVNRIHTNHDCVPSNAGNSVTTKVIHSVAVSGGFEIGGKLEWAAGTLFAKCKLEAHAKVTGNETWTDTEEETIEITSSKDVSPCTRVRYFYDKFRRDRAFVMDAADARFVCRDFHSGKTEAYSCNRGELRSNGTGWDEVQDGWIFDGKLCKCVNGIPVPLRPGDPGFNGEGVPTPATNPADGGG